MIRECTICGGKTFESVGSSSKAGVTEMECCARCGAPAASYASLAMPPEERTVKPPRGDWRERTYYVVRVSFNKGNPIHEAIFYTGFLNGPGGGPGAYNQAWNPAWDEETPDARLDKLHYLEAVAEIPGIGGKDD